MLAAGGTCAVALSFAPAAGRTSGSLESAQLTAVIGSRSAGAAVRGSVL